MTVALNWVIGTSEQEALWREASAAAALEQPPAPPPLPADLQAIADYLLDADARPTLRADPPARRKLSDAD